MLDICVVVVNRQKSLRHLCYLTSFFTSYLHRVCLFMKAVFLLHKTWCGPLKSCHTCMYKIKQSVVVWCSGTDGGSNGESDGNNCCGQKTLKAF